MEYLRKQLNAKAKDNVEIFRKGTTVVLRSHSVDLNQYVPFGAERDLGIETTVISSQSLAFIRNFTKFRITSTEDTETPKFASFYMDAPEDASKKGSEKIEESNAFRYKVDSF